METPSERAPATAKQRDRIRELALERDVAVTARLPHFTTAQADSEIGRLLSLRLIYATAKQRALIRTMARERGVTVDLPKRLPVKAVDSEFKRLKALPKIPKGDH